MLSLRKRRLGILISSLVFKGQLVSNARSMTALHFFPPPSRWAFSEEERPFTEEGDGSPSGGDPGGAGRGRIARSCPSSTAWKEPCEMPWSLLASPHPVDYSELVRVWAVPLERELFWVLLRKHFQMFMQTISTKLPLNQSPCLFWVFWGTWVHPPFML